MPQPGNSLLFTALLLGLPMVLSQTSRLMTDAPLSFFVVGFICCYLWLEYGATDDLRLAGFFAAGMLFTKNEGLGLFVVLLVTMTIALLVQRKLRHSLTVALWLLGVPLVATAVWYVFRSGIPKVSEDYGSRMNPVYFLQNISRVPEILTGSITYWGSVEDWLIFWPVLC
jgi:4-amino-4-deoxy-L-arabinose transferase-like glycosyltransferase